MGKFGKWLVVNSWVLELVHPRLPTIWCYFNWGAIELSLSVSSPLFSWQNRLRYLINVLGVHVDILIKNAHGVVEAVEAGQGMEKKSQWILSSVIMPRRTLG
jgi:hypothetical protein